MAILNRFSEMLPEISEWRRDLHAHPELRFEEHRTADFVAAKLKEFGCDRAQGNFIAPPLSASEFPTWLIGHDPSNSAQSGASEGGASTPPAT